MSGLKPPPDFKLMSLCVQAVTTKGRPKCIIIKKKTREEKTGFRLYTLLHIQKSKLRSVQIYELALVTCNKLNPRS